MEARRAVAAGEGPRQGRQRSTTARTPRARWPSAGRRQRRRHRRAQVRDRLLGQVRRLRLAGPGDWPTRSLAEGEDAVDELTDEHRQPEARPRRRTSRSARSSRFEAADGNVLDTYLHIQDGRGVNARAGRARGRHRRAGPRRGRAHRLRQAAVPAPRRGRRPTPSSRSARRCSRHHASEGKPEQAWPEDRRGPPQRLVQGPGAARTGLRARREADHRPAPRRRRRSCGSPRSSSVTEPGRMTDSGRRRPARWPRVLLKLSGEAFAGEQGYGIDGEVVADAGRARSSRSGPTWASTWPSSSAAATSGGA